MKKYFLIPQTITFLTILVVLTSCNGYDKNDLPKEKEHSKFIKKPGNGNVMCSLQDKAGNLWFGTSDGLYKYDGKSAIQFSVTNGLIGNDIYCIMEDKDGKIWIGTTAGLCFYDGKTFSKVKIPLPKNLSPNKNPGYQKHSIYSMLQAKNGKLWFVTIDGVFVYDGNSFIHFPIDEAENGYLTNNDKVERILEDNAGNIWLGGRTNDGVFRFDGKSVTKFKLEELFQDGPKPKPHSWAWPQWQDKKGNIWFSNWGGAYRYDGKSFTSFTKKDGLPCNITRIVEDKNGAIWLGSSSGLYNFDGKSFTYYKDGLINPWIWTILEDKSGNLWVGTRAVGLYLFDGKTFIRYTDYEH